MDPSIARVKARYQKDRRAHLIVSRRTNLLAITLGALVFTLYGYSMYKIKQETVMFEIDEEAQKSG